MMEVFYASGIISCFPDQTKGNEGRNYIMLRPQYVFEFIEGLIDYDPLGHQDMVRWLFSPQ